MKKIKTFRKKTKKVNSHRKNTNQNKSKNPNKKSSTSHLTQKTFGRNKLKSAEDSNFFKFMLGFGVGFGLKVDASEDLKKCFLSDKKNNAKIIENFIFSEAEKNDNANILAKDKENQKVSALSFTKIAMEFFTKFKDCKAFKETFFAFVKNKIINLGIKGIAYIVAGPLGLLLKGTYDVYKIITEISDFYKLKKQNPIDYYNLGSAVGKIIYYTQNILFRRKKRF